MSQSNSSRARLGVPFGELLRGLRLLALDDAEGRDAECAQMGKCAGALPSCHSGLKRLEEAARHSATAFLDSVLLAPVAFLFL